MTQLPSKRPVGTPRAKAPRGIDSSNVGSVPVASAPSVSTPNLGAGLGQAVSNVGVAIQDREARTAAAQARIDKQNNVIEKARSLRDLQARLKKERESAEDTLDLSLQEDVNTTSQRMFDILEESKANFRGTPDGLAEYIVESEAALGKSLDDVNIKSIKLRRGLVRTEMKRQIDAKILEVQNNPDLLPEAIKDLTGENGLIAGMADSLGIEEEQEFTSQAQQDLTNASISANLRLMTNESLDKVAALLDNPDAQAALGPQELKNARDRLVKFRNALDEDKGDQTPAEEKAELFSKAVQLAKENPERADSIFKGFGFEDVDQSKVGEALDDLKALNERRKDQGRDPLTAEQEDSFISQAVGGVSSIAKDGILVDAFGKTIATNKSLPEDQENDNVKGGKLTVKAVSEIRRQSTALVGIPTGTQGEIIGNPSREKMDLNARAQSEIGELVLQGHDIGAAVQLWRGNQPEGTFPEDITFSQIGENIKGIYLGADARVGEISSDQAKKTIEEVNSDIEKIQLEDATGVTSAMVDFWNSIAGSVSSSLVDPEVARARTEFALAYRNVVQLFALNPRFAIAEQQLLSEMIPGPGVLNDPESARKRLQILDLFIDKQIALNEQLLNKGTGAGTELHKNALQDLADLYQMKSHTRKFNIDSGGPSVTQFGSPEEIDKAKKSEVRKFMNSKTRKEIKDIELQQPELFNALEQKMSGKKPEPKKPEPKKPEPKKPEPKKPEPKKPTAADEVQNSTIQEVEEAIADINARLEAKDFSEIPEERLRAVLKVLQDDLARRNKAKEKVKK